MAIILNIDTAVETASVCLADDDRVMKQLINSNQKDHAAWLHSAINDMVRDAGMKMDNLDAVAVTIGPGSYTGLRIGLAAAKGLCYALRIPLICVNTLEMMAHAVGDEGTDLVCPLIDARRMEVFTAIYNKSLEEVVKPCAMIISADSFAEFLTSHKIIFCGNGSKKLKNILCHPNAIYSDNVANASNLAPLSSINFGKKRFNDIAYTEPFYLKEFHSTAR